MVFSRHLLNAANPKVSRALSLLTLAGLITACQVDPFSAYRQDPQLKFGEQDGKPFKHFLVHKAATGETQLADGHTLHVYIEGDGRPWHTRHQVAWDPSPQSSTVLPLMLADPAPSLYVGRPCYFQLEDPHCSAQWWTHKRYAPEVIESMNRILDLQVDQHAHIVLIGHSGGATLAMLVASQRKDIDAVITLAGNLDIDAWTELHGYSKLEGSLNPIDYPLSSKVKQFHFAGAQDENIPPSMIQKALRPESAKRSGNIVFEVIEDADHQCCWLDTWPEILNKLNRDR